MGMNQPCTTDSMLLVQHSDLRVAKTSIPDQSCVHSSQFWTETSDELTQLPCAVVHKYYWCLLAV